MIRVHQPALGAGYIREKFVEVSPFGDDRVLIEYSSPNDPLAVFHAGGILLDKSRVEELIHALAEVAGITCRTVSAVSPPPAAPGPDAKGWEPVTPVDPEDEECSGDVDRMRVPGGWIYTICHAPGDGQSAVFVPDPK